MLPAELRLKINEARSKYWTNQKYIYTPIFKTVYRIRHGSEKPPKIGFIMTVKVGKATVRNRLKRVISEAIFKEIENLPNFYTGANIKDYHLKNVNYGKDFTGRVGQVMILSQKNPITMPATTPATTAS